MVAGTGLSINEPGGIHVARQMAYGKTPISAWLGALRVLEANREVVAFIAHDQEL